MKVKSLFCFDYLLTLLIVVRWEVKRLLLTKQRGSRSHMYRRLSLLHLKAFVTDSTWLPALEYLSSGCASFINLGLRSGLLVSIEVRSSL